MAMIRMLPEKAPCRAGAGLAVAGSALAAAGVASPPWQSWSMPSPGMSSAPGKTSARESSQSPPPNSAE